MVLRVNRKQFMMWSWSLLDDEILVGLFRLDELIRWSNYIDSTKRHHLLTSIQSYYDRQLTMQAIHWNLFDDFFYWLNAHSHTINVDQSNEGTQAHACFSYELIRIVYINNTKIWTSYDARRCDAMRYSADVLRENATHSLLLGSSMFEKKINRKESKEKRFVYHEWCAGKCVFCFGLRLSDNRVSFVCSSLFHVPICWYTYNVHTPNITNTRWIHQMNEMRADTLNTSFSAVWFLKHLMLFLFPGPSR